MANVVLGARFRRTASAPVADADRDDLTRRLNDGFADGAIPTDDYRALLDQVYAATTNADLVPVADALPATAVSNVPDIVRQDGAPPPGELAPIAAPNRTALVVAGVAASAVLFLIALALVLLGVL